MAVRQRDVLPIHAFDYHNFDRRSVSHCVRKSLTRKNKCLSWANEGVSVVNRIGADYPVPVSSNPGNASILAAQNIFHAYRQMPPPPTSLTSEGALTELLTSSGYYTCDRTDIRPYSKESISWPAQGSQAVELAESFRSGRPTDFD